VGLAFIMVNEATGVVNFATGQMVAIGCFLGVTTSLQMGLPLAPAYVLALAAWPSSAWSSTPSSSVLAGPAGGHRHHRHGDDRHRHPEFRPHDLGLGTFRPRSPFGRQVIDVFGAALSAHALFVIVVSFLMIALLYLFIYRTAIGARMRAWRRIATRRG